MPPCTQQHFNNITDTNGTSNKLPDREYFIHLYQVSGSKEVGMTTIKTPLNDYVQNAEKNKILHRCQTITGIWIYILLT